jgi:hypothetical protein
VCGARGRFGFMSYGSRAFECGKERILRKSEYLQKREYLSELLQHTRITALRNLEQLHMG